MSGLGNWNYLTERRIILAMLKISGPLTSAQIIERHRAPEGVVRTALRFLVDEHRITRTSQREAWHLVS